MLDPADFHPHPKLVRQFEHRAQMYHDAGEVDWATGEALAIGSLVLACHPARFAGEDCRATPFVPRLDPPRPVSPPRRILGQAWADSALFPEEVRNYARRLRKILAELEIPADLVNKPGRGYSLVFRAT